MFKDGDLPLFGRSSSVELWGTVSNLAVTRTVVEYQIRLRTSVPLAASVRHAAKHALAGL